MLNRYKLDFIILGFGGLLLTTDSYRSTTTYYCIKKLTGDGDLGENIMLVTFSMYKIINRSTLYQIGDQHLQLVTNTFRPQHRSNLKL